MTENLKLENGEKYLSIVVLGNIRLAAFKNKNKDNPKQPDYKGDGVAVWITEKKQKNLGKITDLI